MDKIIASLKTLGFTDKEALTYITLLQMGRGSAYAIADKSGLKKPTTHVILGELLKRGLVVTIPDAKRKIFIAKSPDEVFSIVEERMEFAKKVLPTLMSMAAKSRTKVNTLFFDGIAGMKEAMGYRMKEMEGKEIVGFFATADNISPEMQKLFNWWSEEMYRRKINMRGFAPEHQSLDKYRAVDIKYDREFKILPFEKYNANISIDVGDTFVRINTHQYTQSIIIDNPDVAKSVRQIFELLWAVK